MRPIKKVLKLLQMILFALMGLLLLFNTIQIIQRLVLKEQLPTLMGFSQAIVISGSMSPTIEVDDWILIHRQASYHKEDIVTYKGETYPVTHRIVREEKKEHTFITKGDANNTNDAPITEQEIYGKVIFRIPKIGAFIGLIQSPLGAVGTCLVMIGIWELPKMNYFKKEKSENKKRKR